MDPETLTVLTAVFHKATDTIPVARQTEDARMAVATHLLTLAETGERDPDRLLAATLSWINGAGAAHVHQC